MNKIKEKSLFLLIIFIFVSLLVNCSVNPVTGKKELSFLSETQEIAIGNENYPRYTQSNFGVYQDPNLQKYINKLGQNLSSISHRPNLQYEFNVVNSSIVNAYALPGGKISITRGLLNKMNNEAEAAGVLGHEIGHVAARHTVKAYTRSIFANLIVAAGAYYLEKQDVKYKDLYTAGGMLTTNLILLKFSRKQELQADALGLQYMVQNGYDPDGFVETLQILKSLEKKESNKLEVMFSTHPLSTNRIKEAKKQVNSIYFKNKNNNFGKANYAMNTKRLKQMAPAYEDFDTGLSLVSKKRFAEAENYLAKAANAAPDQSIILAFLAKAKEEQKKLNKAKNTIDRSIKLYPNLYHARVISASINEKLGLNKESMRDLKIAEGLLPNQPAVAFYMGKNYEDLGDRGKAVEQYNKVLSLTDSGEQAAYAKKRLQDWNYNKSQIK